MPGSQDVIDADDVLMAKSEQDLDLPQGALAIRLMLERADFLNGHTQLVNVIIGRAEIERVQTAIVNFYRRVRFFKKKNNCYIAHLKHRLDAREPFR